MMEAILYRLNNDAPLSTLLGATPEDTRIYPLSSPNFGPCIAYTDTPVQGGHVRTNSLELRVIAKDYALVRAIEQRLNELLDFTEGGDKDKGWIAEGMNIMSSVLSGGGELEMGEVYQRFPIYTIKWRKI